MESGTERLTETEIADDELRIARGLAVRIIRALLSVSDKTGIVEFARGLNELWSKGGLMYAPPYR